MKPIYEAQAVIHGNLYTDFPINIPGFNMLSQEHGKISELNRDTRAHYEDMFVKHVEALGGHKNYELGESVKSGDDFTFVSPSVHMTVRNKPISAQVVMELGREYDFCPGSDAASYTAIYTKMFSDTPVKGGEAKKLLGELSQVGKVLAYMLNVEYAQSSLEVPANEYVYKALGSSELEGMLKNEDSEFSFPKVFARDLAEVHDIFDGGVVMSGQEIVSVGEGDNLPVNFMFGAVPYKVKWTGMTNTTNPADLDKIIKFENPYQILDRIGGILKKDNKPNPDSERCQALNQ